MARFGTTRAFLSLALPLLTIASPNSQAIPHKAQGTALTALLEDFRTVALAPQGYRIQKRSARIGHLELEFEEGVAFPMRTSTGETLGLLFEGQGRFVYRLEDPGDSKSLLAKAARLHPAPVMTASSIGHSFTTMLAFFATPELGELWKAGDLEPASGSDSAGVKARVDFSRIWSSMNRMNLGPDHLAAEARLNLNSGQYFQAQIQTPSGNLDYRFDTERQQIESLKLSSFDGKNQRPLTDLLSFAELNGGPLAPHGALYLRDLSLEIDVQNPKHGMISSAMGLEVARDGTAVGVFYLGNHLNPDVADWRSETSALILKSVTDSEGRNLPFSHRYHEVLVALPKVLNRGETTELTFRYEGDFSYSHATRDGPSVALWSGTWYPIPDGRSPDGFTYRLQMKTKNPEIPAASGERVSYSEEAGVYQLTVRSTHVVRYIAAVAGPFVVTEKEVESRPIRFYTRRAWAPKTLPDYLGSAFLALTGILGSLPPQDIQIVQVPMSAWAASVPGMIFLSSDALMDSSQLYSGSDPRTWPAQLIAENLASQWMARRAWPKSTRDAWLTEGVRHYTADLVTSLILPQDSREKALSSLDAAHWYSVIQDCAEVTSLRLAGSHSPVEENSIDRCLMGDRSSLTIQMLRQAVGDDTFFGTLQEIFGPTGPDFISTEEFRHRLETSSGRDLGWFFEDWVERDGVPTIEVKWRTTPVQGGFQVSGQALQQQGETFKRLIIPMVFEYGDGGRELHLVFQANPSTEFQFPVLSPPTKITIDPVHSTLARYR
jgi:peptidase M1-like protein